MSANNQNVDFAERLASARRMAGLSLQGLADLMENRISKQAINQFEQGKSKPEAGTLQDMANALNVSLDYFFRTTTSTFEKLASVSYTHLDVYKRQNQFRLNFG